MQDPVKKKKGKNVGVHFYENNVLIFNHSFIIKRNLKNKNINELQILFNSKQ